MHHLPINKHTPVVLLAKHQSAWETLVLPLVVGHPVAYVLKKELLYIPFFGWALATTDMIHIDRTKKTKALAKVIEQGEQLLKKGLWILMFPEGTRTLPGHQTKYKSGGAKLALASGAVVIPIALNTARVWPKNTFIKRPGTVDVVIGKPIATQGLTPEEVTMQVQQWIETQMCLIDAKAYKETQ
jgi:1-acyl-sn-glycerol-3-phosphate acyltransferase